MFSRRAISEIQYLIRDQVRFISAFRIYSCLIEFCSWIDSVTYSRNKTQPVSDFYAICLPLTLSHPGKSSDLYLGFQCLAADVVTNFLFATCFDQLSFPDFQGDIVKGVDMSLPALTLGRFSSVFIWIVRHFPPSILMRLAPSLKGLVIFKQVSLNGCLHVVQKTDPPVGASKPGRKCFAKPGTVG